MADTITIRHLATGRTASGPAGSAVPEGFEIVTPAAKPDTMSPLRGGIADTLGLTDRPGARTPVDVLVRPEGVAEHLAQAAVTAPLIALGGGGAGALAARAGIKAAPRVISALGRVAASGGIGAGKAVAQGGDATLAGLLDAAVAGTTEAVGGVAGKVAGRLAGPAARAVGERTSAALAQLRARLPQRGAFFNLPSVGTSKLTLDQAVKSVRDLAKTDPNRYPVARGELLSELTRLDAQRLTGPRPLAGKVMGDAMPKAAPSGFQAAAGGVERAATSPTGRVLADTAMTQDIPGTNIPAGVGVGAALSQLPASVLGRLARTVMP